MSIAVAINAHLLSAQAGYRSAGIHGYIYQTLRHLPLVQPTWHYQVLVGEGVPPEHPALTVERAQFSTTSPLRRILWEQLLQPRVIRRLKPDLYHGMAFVSPRGLPCPSLVTVYDLSFMRFPHALSRARRLYLQTFTEASCRRAARVLAISASTAHDLTEVFGLSPEKITVAIPGVDARFQPLPPEIIAEFRQKKGLPQQFLLHLGTLEPRKNLPMLLRAYAALPADLRQTTPLILAGGLGWDYQVIFETIARLGLEEQVKHMGYVNAEELPLWYNAALALVYPSLYEGWGLPVVEAMACGCPTLVSEVSSLPEAAGETGLRLPPEDETAWTLALEKAIADETWRKISRAAGLDRARQFTWTATAQATLTAYQQVLES